MADRAKFEQEAIRHMNAAYTLALHLLAQPADAEDAVQDAFIRAFRSYHQLQGDPKPWLLTIVRNVCYRRMQERRRSGNVISLDEALLPGAGAIGESDIAAQQHTPEAAAIGASDSASVSRAIAALAPVFREVIVLREIEGLSYREVADVIGAPVGTVMSRLSRAREQLRTQLRQLLEQDDRDAV